MATISDELMQEVKDAHKDLGSIPMGSMTHEQWVVLARAYNAIERVLDETGN